ncbi:MAG: hypothetical protein ACRDZW_11480 [Acidimicrobiales bacterium]
MSHEVWAPIPTPIPPETLVARPNMRPRLGVCHAVVPGAGEALCGQSLEDMEAVDREWLDRTIERCDPCREATGLVPGA